MFSLIQEHGWFHHKRIPTNPTKKWLFNSVFAYAWVTFFKEYGFSPVGIHLCFSKFDFCAKEDLHTSQESVSLPVCVHLYTNVISMQIKFQTHVQGNYVSLKRSDTQFTTVSLFSKYVFVNIAFMKRKSHIL